MIKNKIIDHLEKDKKLHCEVLKMQQIALYK